MAIVICTAGAAAADPIVPNGHLVLAAGFGSHVSRVADRTEGGVDGLVQLGFGSGRWQVLVEGKAGTTGLGNTATTPALEMAIDGSRLRAGAEVRWLARQFAPENDCFIEMSLAATVGIERYAFDDHTRIVRPDLGVGVGWDIRAAAIHDLTTRMEVMLVFTPDEHTALVACRGTTCDGGDNHPIGGFEFGFVFGW
jgi:hypothetical protein